MHLQTCDKELARKGVCGKNTRNIHSTPWPTAPTRVMSVVVHFLTEEQQWLLVSEEQAGEVEGSQSPDFFLFF